MSSVLSREFDSYQSALNSYRRKYSSAVEEQNVALRDLQNGRRTLIPTEKKGVYVIARGVDSKGNFNLEKKKVGGFLGIGGEKVPRTVTGTPEQAHQKTGLRILPSGPTEDLMGQAPQAPNPSMAQIRRSQQASLADVETGLIGQVIQGKGVRQEGLPWQPPESVAQQMYDRAHPKPTPMPTINLDPAVLANIQQRLNGSGRII